MTEFQPGLHNCMNCGNPTKGNHDYEGVVLCSNCFSLAQMCYNRAMSQCSNLLTMYRESLRTALACGRIRPVTKIVSRDGDKITPPTTDDLKTILSGLANVLHKDPK